MAIENENNRISAQSCCRSSSFETSAWLPPDFAESLVPEAPLFSYGPS